MERLDHLRIVRKEKGGVLSAWIEPTTTPGQVGIEIFIRESLDRGRDVQTVCLSVVELKKILAALTGEKS